MISVSARLLKRLSLIFLIIVAILFFEKFNLQVSYKYEVDHMKSFVLTDKKVSSSERNLKLREIEKHELEIARDQKIVEALLWGSVAGLVITTSLWARRWFDFLK